MFTVKIDLENMSESGKVKFKNVITLLGSITAKISLRFPSWYWNRYFFKDMTEK